jgi:hypothetical protein
VLIAERALNYLPGHSASTKEEWPVATNQIIRPDPPSPEWEADLARSDQQFALRVQQQARRLNPFLAAHGVMNLLKEARNRSETQDEVEAYLATCVVALYPLRNDKRFLRMALVLTFWRSRDQDTICADCQEGGDA